MAKRMRKRAQQSTEVLDRVRYLFEKKWGANQCRMAESIGISQPTLSRVLAGRRPAGKSLLLALGTYPGISLDWLLHGTGHPFAPAGLLPPSPGFLPIAAQPLRGKPSKHADQLTGDFFPVAEPLCRASLYWLRIDAAHVSGLDTDHGLRADDLLLLDTDLSSLASAAQRLGQIAVACPHDDGVPRLVVLGSPEPGTAESARTSDDSISSFGAHLRRLKLDAATHRKTDRLREPPSPPVQARTDIDVVAIGIQMVRRLWP
jgi:hypothetical protein